MNPMMVLQFTLAVLDALPGLVAAGKDVAEFAVQQRAVLSAMEAEGRDPTPAEWAALGTSVAADEAEVHRLAGGST
ncbi:MAG TPA: hypothetical protein VMV33_17050 [Rhodocyclaceae bacterium]|nr:hypothetical protein [Rhodocyclaceae bacterium]